ncbi:pre-rRNA-processing protein TSR2 homolog [Aplochiton taeniatus]
MDEHRTTRELFTEAVKTILESWPVLQISVDNGFGGVYGQQKADWMVDVVQQYFRDNDNLLQYEVEDYIATLMDQEFDAVVDDGSLPQVAQSLCQLFGQCQRGMLTEVRQTLTMLAQKNTARLKVAAAPSLADQEGEYTTEEESETMECEGATASTSAPQRVDHFPPPTPEEKDGWTTVVRKK